MAFFKKYWHWIAVLVVLGIVLFIFLTPGGAGKLIGGVVGFLFLGVNALVNGFRGSANSLGPSIGVERDAKARVDEAIKGQQDAIANDQRTVAEQADSLGKVASGLSAGQKGLDSGAERLSSVAESEQETQRIADEGTKQLDDAIKILGGGTK